MPKLPNEIYFRLNWTQSLSHEKLETKPFQSLRLIGLLASVGLGQFFGGKLVLNANVDWLGLARNSQTENEGKRGREEKEIKREESRG